MTPSLPPRGRLAGAAAVFVLHLSLLLLTWNGWRGIFDSDCMLSVAHAIVVDHTVEITMPRSQVKGTSVYGLGQSLLFMPAVVLARVLPPPPSMSPEALERSLASFTNPVMIALVGAVLFAAGCAFGLRPWRALVLATLAVFGTPLWSLTQYQMSEPGTALALLAAALATTARGSAPRLAAAGLLWGFAALARPVELATLPAFVAGFLCDLWWSAPRPPRREWLRRVGAAAAGFLPMLVLYLAYNHARFGSLLVTSYNQPGGPNILFRTTQSMTGIIATLLWERRIGMLWFAPAAFLGLLMTPLLVRRRMPVGVIALVAFLIQLLVHARSGVWAGKPFWGPRYLVPVMPLVLLGLVPLLGDGAAAVALVIVVGIGSIAINAVGELHDTANTYHRLAHGEDVLTRQLQRISTSDLDFPAMRTTSGTFWPTFSLFGCVLVVLAAVSLLALAGVAGRLRRAHLAAAVVVPVVFVAAREWAVPYRVLSARPFAGGARSDLPLASAVPIRGMVAPAPDALSIATPGRAGLQVHLRPGLHRVHVELASRGPVAWSVWLVEDVIASGTLPPDGQASVDTLPVRVRREGDYTLHLGAAPVGDWRHATLVCRAITLETLP